MVAGEKGRRIQIKNDLKFVVDMTGTGIEVVMSFSTYTY